MREEFLGNFFLAGGTALALQIGHRLSIDLDLFTVESFDENAILEELEYSYSFRVDYQAKNTLKGEIDGVKVDLVAHRYPLVQAVFEEENVRLASSEDIAAMKLNAIVVNGTRLKDFIDVAYLSSLFSLSKMIAAYEAKYQTRNPSTVIKSLDYQFDINFLEPIRMISNEYSWEQIRARLNEMTLHPDTKFHEFPHDF